MASPAARAHPVLVHRRTASDSLVFNRSKREQYLKVKQEMFDDEFNLEDDDDLMDEDVGDDSNNTNSDDDDVPLEYVDYLKRRLEYLQMKKDLMTSMPAYQQNQHIKLMMKTFIELKEELAAKIARDAALDAENKMLEEKRDAMRRVYEETRDVMLRKEAEYKMLVEERDAMLQKLEEKRAEMLERREIILLELAKRAYLMKLLGK
ncbi:hypothetical protein LWI28_000302 [Acer negundo]|uniref:Uncharacterized protein n=1 Tax=Acer negundo TaxID=4023 RepID=A0AAD5I512_ACENE|nr:hypothetical protein LWI28_000302 [Acer negundo]